MKLLEMFINYMKANKFIYKTNPQLLIKNLDLKLDTFVLDFANEVDDISNL